MNKENESGVQSTEQMRGKGGVTGFAGEHRVGVRPGHMCRRQDRRPRGRWVWT